MTKYCFVKIHNFLQKKYKHINRIYLRMEKSLHDCFGHRKTIPPEIREVTIKALSFYPAL
jgi:hypothetical protein